MGHAADLYRAAARVYSKHNVSTETQNALERTWEVVLGRYTRHELREAWDWWRGNTEQSYDGRPKGSFMPTPPELKGWIERNREVTEAQRTGRFVACLVDGCVDGWLYRPEGRTVNGNTLTYDARTEEGVRQMHTEGVVRCGCWWIWLAGKLGVTVEQLPEALKQRQRERAETRTQRRRRD